MRSGGGIYAIDIEDDVVRPRAGGHKSLVEEEIRRVAPFIDRDANVLVVGANIGTVAIPIARQCRELWAIEANPRTFELLNFNIKLNDAHNVHALNIMAGEREEETEFILNRTNSGGSKRMPKRMSFAYRYDRPQIVRLKTQALDVALGKIEFSLVFMDIEGSEYFALKGMQNILSRANTLFVEFMPHHLRDVSGVSPEEFVEAIEPHFDSLFIPSKNLTVGRPEFKHALRRMYDNGEADAGLVFRREGS
jgi:FkbM family methyltransferase